MNNYLGVFSLKMSPKIILDVRGVGALCTFELAKIFCNMPSQILHAFKLFTTTLTL